MEAKLVDNVKWPSQAQATVYNTSTYWLKYLEFC